MSRTTDVRKAVSPEHQALTEWIKTNIKKVAQLAEINKIVAALAAHGREYHPTFRSQTAQQPSELTAVDELETQIDELETQINEQLLAHRQALQRLEKGASAGALRLVGTLVAELPNRLTRRPRSSSKDESASVDGNVCGGGGVTKMHRLLSTCWRRC